LRGISPSIFSYSFFDSFINSPPLNYSPSQSGMTIDERYMSLALSEAKAALQQDEIPIGAVIVANGEIIGRGHNLTETLHDVTAHAEMQAITAAAETLGGKYLDKCTLYVTVEPCVMCAGAIAWSQMGRLVFGASDEKRGYRRYAPDALHPKTEVVSGILEEECASLMKDFFKGKRK
jgi:tRNA(adenine34) deaminase